MQKISVEDHDWVEVMTQIFFWVSLFFIFNFQVFHKLENLWGILAQKNYEGGWKATMQ
jgi:hypothetical protein